MSNTPCDDANSFVFTKYMSCFKWFGFFPGRRAKPFGVTHTRSKAKHFSLLQTVWCLSGGQIMKINKLGVSKAIKFGKGSFRINNTHLRPIIARVSFSVSTLFSVGASGCLLHAMHGQSDRKSECMWSCNIANLFSRSEIKSKL